MPVTDYADALAVLEREHTGVARAAVALANAVRSFEALGSPEAFHKMAEARRAFDRAASRVV